MKNRFNYIEDCFVEFKDDSKYQYEIEEDEHAEPGSYIIGIGVNTRTTSNRSFYCRTG
jgi:hypothetical protein